MAPGIPPEAFSHLLRRLAHVQLASFWSANSVAKAVQSSSAGCMSIQEMKIAFVLKKASCNTHIGPWLLSDRVSLGRGRYRGPPRSHSDSKHDRLTSPPPGY